MGKVFTGAVMSLFLTVSVSADLVVTKHNGGGFVPPEWARYEKCEVHTDKVVITRNYGVERSVGFKYTETRAIQLSDPVKNVLKKAKTEPVKTKPNFLCDGPSTTILSQDGTATVTLYNTGGCGTPSEERNGPASKMLRDLVDSFCPKTFRAPNL